MWGLSALTIRTFLQLLPFFSHFPDLSYTPSPTPPLKSRFFALSVHVSPSLPPTSFLLSHSYLPHHTFYTLIFLVKNALTRNSCFPLTFPTPTPQHPLSNRVFLPSPCMFAPHFPLLFHPLSLPTSYTSLPPAPPQPHLSSQKRAHAQFFFLHNLSYRPTSLPPLKSRFFALSVHV